MSAVTEIPTSPDLILDAAEALWAVDSYEGVSIRGIMAHAGLELSLARYYFGNKEGLLHKVIARRADGYCKIIHASLDAASNAAVDGVPTVEAWVRALLEPVFSRLAGPDPGWRNYIRLLATFSLEHQDEKFLSVIHKYYDSIYIHFVQGLNVISPGEEADSLWLFYFLHAATISIYRNSEILGRFMPSSMNARDYNVVLNQLIRHFGAAYRGRIPV